MMADTTHNAAADGKTLLKEWPSLITHLTIVMGGGGGGLEILLTPWLNCPHFVLYRGQPLP